MVPTGMLFKRHGIARLNIRALAGDDRVADREALRRENIGPFAVLIFNERDERRTVRVVFKALDGSGHVEFAALEIDEAVSFFVTAADAERCQAAIIIAPAGFGFAVQSVS